MNYMLLENKTLNMMDDQHFDYINPCIGDPMRKSQESSSIFGGKAKATSTYHTKNITSIEILYPEMLEENAQN